MRFASVIAVAVALTCQLGACGSSGGSSTAESSTTTAGASAPQEAPVQAAGGDWPMLKRLAGGDAAKLIVPQGPSPDHVVVRDLENGRGPAIETGDVFLSRYISFDYENEAVIEPSPEESNGKPAWVDAGSLKWGLGERVPGWEPGLEGIRAGGVRELIVPSRLAYENGVRVYLVKVMKIEPR